MAGVLNFSQPSLFRPLSGSRQIPRTSFSIRATSESSKTPQTPSSSSTTSTQEKPEPTPFAAPPNFKPPEPKRFAVRPDKALDILGAALALFFRFGTGVFVSGYSASFVSKDEIPPDQYAMEIAGFKVKETSKLGPRPEKPIEIYEYESCPFCRKVREIVAVLDLDVLYYPCPRNGPNFRPKVLQMGGKKQFPYMVDPNTGVSMYESDNIIKYLVGKYGDGSIPFMLSLGLLTTLTEGFAMIGRLGKGQSYTPAKLPPKPLEVWAYEGSPFCKVVREVLVELELPHLQRSCARGSPKRQILIEKAKHFQVPYLEDPNTGVQMFESADIVEYLRATYAQ
ncbi:Thioredoxin family protein [Citrus sinensis]|uniref:Thioredoxin family protein n=1 Tax=Citrus sinensis TaxID=2711 RepID=A0ACB8K2H3_CITSI|nr:Thioredoxin family protein [Citrus sinensis]